MEHIKSFIGELARPLAIIFTSAAASWATVVIAYKVSDGNDGAIFITGVFAGVGALYIGKAFELTRIAAHTSEVEKVKASATPPPGAAAIIAAPDVDVAIREAEPAEDPAMYGGPRP
ncbi:hypothetical protein LRS10_09370 [Phenylobacterium sp. J426]|uniref:hypothetical protein n=1 Tax=Phenylobacterium sp. J426 TaxID=2898439 RepID=UPI002151EE4C|nr:hypothetical protein [Phenylobacterium sp. J426]MCR5874352.1 hypothetical protein [Phenylobacterium sp. J426]